jgi:hypothetical protein
MPDKFSWNGYFGGANYMTPVKDQGQCGSSWAFASVGDMEAQYQISTNNPGMALDLSEQNILSCSSGTCSGWDLGGALEFLKNSGTPDEACDCYTGAKTSCGLGRCDDYLSRIYHITAGPWISTDADTIKYYLYTHGPVIVWMPIFNDFPWNDPYYWGGGGDPNLNPDCYLGGCFYGHGYSPSYVGQFVVIVGWDDQDPDMAGDEYWIVRNSWGANGGDVYSGYGGYFYMTQDPVTGFFGIHQEAAVILDVKTGVPLVPPQAQVKSKTIFVDDKFSGVRVKVEWRESGHKRRVTLATPFSLDPNAQGLYKFTAPSTVRAGGVQYRFAHWEDETDAILSAGRTLTYDVQSGKTFYAVYGPRQYKLTLEVKDATGARVSGATVEVTQPLGKLTQTYATITNSRGKAAIGGIYAGQPFNLKITVNGIVRYYQTLTITRNTKYKVYLT